MFDTHCLKCLIMRRVPFSDVCSDFNWALFVQAEMRDTTLAQCETFTVCFILPLRVLVKRKVSLAPLEHGYNFERGSKKEYSSLLWHVRMQKLHAYEITKADKSFISHPHQLLSNAHTSPVTGLKSKSTHKPVWAQGELSFLASVECGVIKISQSNRQSLCSIFSSSSALENVKSERLQAVRGVKIAIKGQLPYYLFIFC